MTRDNRSQVTTRLGQKKWPLVALLLGVLFVLALVAVIFIVGFGSANPWGEAPGPDP